MNPLICFISLSTDVSLPVCVNSLVALARVTSTVTLPIRQKLYLQQCCNGKCRNAAIGIGNEILHIQIARRHGIGVVK
jgi:hypothetical protein